LLLRQTTDGKATSASTRDLVVAFANRCQYLVGELAWSSETRRDEILIELASFVTVQTHAPARVAS
jgi:hypothetical protein